MYSHSPLARSTPDLSDVTHEYEPDVDADGFRHPGNHHAELPGEYSPGSTLRPQSKQGRTPSKAARSFGKVRSSFGVEEKKRDAFTFEHEPDVDAEGFRHHHENMSSPALRALQDVVVPLDPRAGRIVITPSPSLKPNYSPYRHIDDIPNRSIDDLQDPEELHSHANMIYGIDEANASQYSVPDWQEGEAATFIEEASHGELHPPTVSERKVDTKLPIEPTGELIAPVGGIAGDNRPVGPTRVMSQSEVQGVPGVYTEDGEGSAGLPFDANSGTSKKEGDIEISDESSVVPPEMSASTETIRQGHHTSIASAIQQPDKPRAGTPGPVEDIKIPEEKPLSQDGSAMDVAEGVKDERPDWLRAAEMMANNEYEKLSQERLITNERASRESIDFASAARATIARDSKMERGTSYPSFAEMEQANIPSTQNVSEKQEGPRQGVSHLPEKDLGGENPPSGSSAREDKLAVETETPSLKAKDTVEPATASKFLGLSAGAAVGASLPVAALMTSERDAKSGTKGETNVAQPMPSSTDNDPATVHARAMPSVPKRPVAKEPLVDSAATANTSQSQQPVVPRRPQPKSTEEDSAKVQPTVPARPKKEGTTTSSEKTAPVIPRRPASSTGAKDSPHVPSRPVKSATAPRETEIKAPIPTKPSIPNRPTPGKLAGSSKFAFASALEAKLKNGPGLSKKKEAEEPEVEAPQDKPAEAAKPLADARKGRARGPQKRKPPTASVTEEPQEVQPVASPVFEKGPTFTSRFGVEMRSVSVQTGVIKISTPSREMTVMEGAGTDYIGQTVVVEASHAKPHAISKAEREVNFEPLENTAEPTSNKQAAESKEAEEDPQKAAVPVDNKLGSSAADGHGLEIPTITIQDAAGGEMSSLEKNHMGEQPHPHHHVRSESVELAAAKMKALEDELVA